MKKYFLYMLMAAVPAMFSSCDDDNDGPKEDPDPYAYVDLGLSVMWAQYNVGAEAPEQFGGYYAWGETEEKEVYSSATYTLKNADGEFTDLGDICGTEYDVAHVKWGYQWRMPSCQEIQELVNECKWEWTAIDGKGGYTVTGPNGNSIFLPATGYKMNGSTANYEGENGSYWSGTPKENSSTDAYYLVFGSRYRFDYSWRFAGQPVRAVRPAPEK